MMKTQSPRAAKLARQKAASRSKSSPRLAAPKKKPLQKTVRQKRAGRSGTSARGLKRPSPKTLAKRQVIGQVFIWLVVGGACLALILALAYNFFLPNFFKLQENKNWLFIYPDLDSQVPNQVFFGHFNPEIKAITLVEIDPELRVRLLSDYGEYPLRSIYPLLQLSGQAADEQYLQAAYSLAIGEVVDRVVVMDQARNLPEPQQLKKVLWQEAANGPGVDNEGWQVYFFAEQGQARRSLQIGVENWDKFGRENFSRPMMMNCAVVVVNATSESGLANRIAGILEKAGFMVTREGNHWEKLAKTTIYYDEGSHHCSELVERGIKMLPFAPEVREGGEVPGQYRAGVVVVAGSDLVEQQTP